MADSISQQIKKLIKKRPDISNAELYKAFPGTRTNTLKHYKAKFVEEFGASKKAKPATVTKAKATVKTAAKKATPKAKATVKAAAKKAAPKAKATVKVAVKKAAPKAKATVKATVKKAAPKAKSPATLKKSKKVTVTKNKSIPAKKTVAIKTTTKPELEKRLVAMERQVKELLGEKVGKGSGVKTSITSKARDLEVNLISFIKEKKKSLDELQHYVTNEVSSFLTSIKNKKD